MAIEVQNIEIDGQPISIQGGNSTPVTVNGTVATTTATSNTATITQVVLTANTNTTLLVANANRKKFIVFIPKSTTYVKYGAIASSISFTWASLSNNATIDDTIWTGQIDILSTVGQTVTVTELA